jgi:2,4-dienoyl-CoA reductase-like NADH-dependent reductase (Old Yellow Enzyme family)
MSDEPGARDSPARDEERVVQIKRLRRPADLRARLDALGIADDLPIAEPDAIAATLGQSLALDDGNVLANRFAILPMEGWDGTAGGRPTDLVRRRWARFGSSGAALVWGGEAVAVTPDGRANPHQLCIGPDSERDLAELRTLLLDAHRSATGDGPPPRIGLQLTHSGRWSRPSGEPEPRTAHAHPLIDARVGANAASVLTDTELDDLVGAFVHAATVAQSAGFDFVDVKHCHGYLLHELLSAHERAGVYGGNLAGRMHFLDCTVAGIRRAAPGLDIGVRLSVFDVAPYIADPVTGVGIVDPDRPLPYRYAFGGDADGTGIDLTEPHEFCAHLIDLGVTMLCVTAGSPYYCPHVQRPAYFPPSDGYLPPRDPLLEVARLTRATRELARAHPQLTIVASGLTYLQEWFPAVAAALVARGDASCIGYGRAALSIPTLASDVLAGRAPDRASLCRTFSDCTTAPRHGLVSGCYPLDDFYKSKPERRTLTAAKRAAEAARGGGRRRA